MPTGASTRNRDLRSRLRGLLYEPVIAEARGRHAPEMLRIVPLLVATTFSGAFAVWLIFVGLARLQGADVRWWWPRSGDLDGGDSYELARATATLVALLGGLFAIVYAYRKQRVAEAAGRREDEANLRESERQITERYSRSVEHIGHENRAIRIGGLYALERIAKDAPKDRDTVTQLLNAFVREHRRTDDRRSVAGPVESDVQLAITLLGRRSPIIDEPPLDFYDCGLDDAAFDGNFANAWFYYCNLKGTRFSGAFLDEAGFSFCEGSGVAFTNASARGANFVNASYTDGWFLSADLTGADFYGCDLSGSDFGRRYATEGNPPMGPAIVHGARFNNAVLVGTNLRGVDLSSAVGLQPDQLACAIVDDNTVAPDEWGGGEDEWEDDERADGASETESGSESRQHEGDPLRRGRS